MIPQQQQTKTRLDPSIFFIRAYDLHQKFPADESKSEDRPTTSGEHALPHRVVLRRQGSPNHEINYYSRKLVPCNGEIVEYYASFFSPGNPVSTSGNQPNRYPNHSSYYLLYAYQFALLLLLAHAILQSASPLSLSTLSPINHEKIEQCLLPCSGIKHTAQCRHNQLVKVHRDHEVTPNSSR